MKNLKYLIILFSSCVLNFDAFAVNGGSLDDVVDSKIEEVEMEIGYPSDDETSDDKKIEIDIKNYSDANINKMFALAEKLNSLEFDLKEKVISFFTDPEQHLDISFQEIENVKDLDKEGINQNVIKIISKEKLEPCSICLDKLDSNDLMFVGACRHRFHDKCIKTAVASAEERRRRSDNPSAIDIHACPYCRQNLLSIKVDDKEKNSELILTKGDKTDFENMNANDLKNFLIKRLFYLAKIYLDRNQFVKWNNFDENSFFAEILKLLSSDEEKYRKIREEANKKVVCLDGLLIDLTSDLKFVALLMIGENLAVENLAVTELHLDNNQITNIEPLKDLMSLKRLGLAGNQITNIKPLKGLTSLEWLDLAGNQITNIEPLKDLMSLKVLNLKNDQITNIEPLKDLMSLKWLGLAGNQITNIESLKGLTSLERLYLDNNQITNIEPLKDLMSLKRLGLAGNQITNIKPLKGLTSLEQLNLKNDQITNIESLKGLTSLERLSLDNNKITNIESLKGLTSLEWLSLDNNKIINIELLKGLTSLEQLGLYGNEITNIEFLSNLTSLKLLILGENKITNIEPLKDLVSLEKLYLNNNKITDIKSLKGLAKLEVLFLQENEIINIEFLSNLISLKDLGVKAK